MPLEIKLHNDDNSGLLGYSLSFCDNNKLIYVHFWLPVSLFADHQSLLTPEQLAAACHAQGHARVLAVAGAGKTRMLIARIAWLLDQGAEAKRIRVLTYNREAADDFRYRLQSAIGANAVTVQTFHALGWKLLQRLMAQGKAPAWRLASGGQETALKREALRLCQLDQEQLENLGQAIEWVKGLASPLDLSLTLLPEGMRSLAPAIRQLEQLQAQAKVWFFTDMLYAPWRLLSQQQSLREEFANHLDYLLVDEYQDVNEVQHVLLHWLAGERAQVMVVGDVDQCIYTWRGANPDFLAQRFVQDFVGAQTHYLPHSFRFGHSLALLANHAIDANPWEDRRAVLATATAKSTDIRCLIGHEATQVITALTQWHQQGNEWSTSAVLVRLWVQAAPIELALLQAKIPYRLLGERSVWDVPTTQGLMALLMLATGALWQETTESRWQWLNAFWQLPPLGMAKAQRERLVQLSVAQPEAVVDAIESLPEERAWLKKHWQARASVWQQLVSGAWRELSAQALITRFLQETDATNRLEKLSSSVAQGELQQGVIRALRDAIQPQMSAAEALVYWQSLRQDALVGAQQADAVSLTTIHRVKGREWDAVIVAGLQEGAFPSQKASEVLDLLYEERRLFYVAITRARRQLSLCVADMSLLDGLWHKGETANSAGQNCRFLAESNLHLCQQLGAYLHGETGLLPQATDVRIANTYLQAQQRTERLSAKAVLQQGTRLQHDKFGAGLLMSCNGDKIEVMFSDGVRWLKADHPSLSWS